MVSLTPTYFRAFLARLFLTSFISVEGSVLQEPSLTSHLHICCVTMYFCILMKLIKWWLLLKMLGVKRIERVLPVGTSLTVVGEVWYAFWVEIVTPASHIDTFLFFFLNRILNFFVSCNHSGWQHSQPFIEIWIHLITV